MREEQLGGTEAAVRLGDAKDAFGVQLDADDHVVLKVSASFRESRAARRVQPESRIVPAGRLRLQVAGALRQQIVERADCVLGRADDDDLPQMRKPLTRDRTDM